MSWYSFHTLLLYLLYKCVYLFSVVLGSDECDNKMPLFVTTEHSCRRDREQGLWLDQFTHVYVCLHMSLSEIYSTVTCNIGCCGKTSLKPSSVMHRSLLISVFSEIQTNFVCVWLCTCPWPSSVLPVHLSVCLSNHLALCNPHHKPRKTQLWPMTTLQRTEKHVLFVLFAKRPIIFAHNAFQPIKALWGFIK